MSATTPQADQSLTTAPLTTSLIEKRRQHLSATAPSPYRATKKETSSESPPITFESLVGGRWFAVLGAFATVIGIGLFLKLAYDQGWLGRIPPVIRCWSGAGFGALLLVAGEAARKRLGAWASAGLSGAGIAAIYASAYAVFTLFQLVTQPTVFTLLALTSALGVAIAARSRFAPLAVIAMIGAYLVPFLLPIAHNQPLVLPVYLVALLSVGVSLSGWLRAGFRSVGALTWWATIILGGIWVLANLHPRPIAVLLFLTSAWTLVQSGLIVGSRLPSEDEGTYATFNKNISLAIFTSLATTVWTVAFAVYAVRELEMTRDWLAPLVGCAITAGTALITASRLRFVIDGPTSSRENLGAGYMIQAAGLLIASVAMAASGVTQLVLWLSMGVAAIAARRWTGSRAVGVYGFVLLLIGVGRLISIDLLDDTLTNSGVTIAGLYLTRWAALAAGASACWLIAAILWPRDEQSTSETSPVATAISVLLLMGSMLHTRTESVSIAVAWLLIGVIAVSFTRLVPKLMLGPIGLAAMTLSIGAWAKAFLSFDNHLWRDASAPLGLHPGLWLAVGIALALTFGARYAFPPREDGKTEASMIRGSALAIGATLFWIASSLEVARFATHFATARTTQLAAVSIWWAVLATGLILAGFVLKNHVTRWVGLALMGIAAGKVVLVDLQNVPAMWRVISFLLVGLLMLGIAAIYARAMKAVRRTSALTPELGGAGAG